MHSPGRSKLGIGLMDPRSYTRSARIVKTYGKLKKLPGHEAYRTDIAKGAQAILKKQHSTSTASNWKKATVKVTPEGSKTEVRAGTLGVPLH
jgi:hypothetical protein